MSGRGQAVNLGGGSQLPAPVISIFLPGLVGPTGANITNNWFRVPRGGIDLTGATAHIIMQVAAGGTNPVWDVLRSTNDGGSFSSILPGTKLIAVVGQKVTNLPTPAWTVTTLNEGDLLQVDLTTTDDGTGGNIEITIVLEPQ